MFITMNRIYISDDYTGDFEERFRTRAGEVDKAPGFVRNLVLRPAGHRVAEDLPREQPYVVMTMWKSKEDFDAWVDSDAFKKGHGRSGTLPKEAFSRMGGLETFEAFLDSGS